MDSLQEIGKKLNLKNVFGKDTTKKIIKTDKPQPVPQKTSVNVPAESSEQFSLALGNGKAEVAYKYQGNGVNPIIILLIAFTVIVGISLPLLAWKGDMNSFNNLLNKFVNFVYFLCCAFIFILIFKPGYMSNALYWLKLKEKSLFGDDKHQIIEGEEISQPTEIVKSEHQKNNLPVKGGNEQ